MVHEVGAEQRSLAVRVDREHLVPGRARACSSRSSSVTSNAASESSTTPARSSGSRAEVKISRSSSSVAFAIWSQSARWIT